MARYTAKALPRQPGVSGWVALLPERRPRPALQGAVTADVAIIGAGFAGLAAARRLSQLDPTLRVAVLEAGVVGEGPAGRNSGFIIDLPHEVSAESLGSDSADHARRDIFKNRTALALAQGMAEEHGWGPEVFSLSGRYSIARGAAGDDHLVDYARQLDGLGEAHRLLDAEETARLTGTRSFSSALFTPGTAMIQPADFVRRFADALRDPVNVYEQSPVLSFERQGSGWQVTTRDATVTAGRVILAVNGHAQSFGLLPRKLMHVFTYASLTKPFDPALLGGERNWAATPALPMGTTIRRLSGPDGDRILVRSRYTYNPSITVSDAALASAGRVHDRKLASRFPVLAGLAMQYRWAGAMALTWNSVPVVEEVDQGLWLAAGCNGVGATNATANGIVAAERALGHLSKLGEHYREAAPAKAIPPEPVATIGGKAALRWKEWRAGDE
ncbi:MAG: FAD-binding oxidoreductase [Fuscovulum sp.]|nr:FAD-binding oxidoreductase [Fuscovulum sp.]